MKPDYLVGLTEEKRPARTEEEGAGNKVDQRIIQKSFRMLNKTIEFIQNEGKGNTKIIASLMGSNHIDLRIEGFKQLLELGDQIDGVVVHGLKDHTDRKDVLDALSAFTLAYPDDKVLMLSSEGSLLDILQGICYGFNSFDTFYPFRLAMEGKSINFSPKTWYAEYSKLKGSEEFSSDLATLRSREWSSIEIPIIDLNDKKYMEQNEDLLWDDTSEIVQGYSKAYICHLLDNKEMTGNVLLSMHNAKVLEEFIATLKSEEFKNEPAQMIDYFIRFVCKN